MTVGSGHLSRLAALLSAAGGAHSRNQWRVASRYAAGLRRHRRVAPGAGAPSRWSSLMHGSLPASEIGWAPLRTGPWRARSAPGPARRGGQGCVPCGTIGTRSARRSSPSSAPWSGWRGRPRRRRGVSCTSRVGAGARVAALLSAVARYGATSARTQPRVHRGSSASPHRRGGTAGRCPSRRGLPCGARRR